jgi:hypothetical protein
LSNTTRVFCVTGDLTAVVEKALMALMVMHEAINRNNNLKGFMNEEIGDTS